YIGVSGGQRCGLPFAGLTAPAAPQQGSDDDQNQNRKTLVKLAGTTHNSFILPRIAIYSIFAAQ
ncbi:MAG: hypothetical protein VZS44_12270, partial [Bacilli bacterium]|nr:hypothetical protein [Bacilli bacterium]